MRNVAQRKPGRSSGRPLLSVRDLRVDLGGRPIVRGVSFTLGSGELTCILGPNGCGKTTTLRALLGLTPSKQGFVEVEGISTTPLGDRDRALLFAYVPQSHEPSFSYDVEDVVLMGRTPHLGLLSQITPSDEKIARDCMRRLGIAELARRPFTQLSGGQQQLVLIARALAQQPRVLVMDEPCASLDFGNQLVVMRQARALANDGMGVLMVTHDPDHALGFADQVVVMQDGGVLAQGSPGDVLTDDLLSGLYHLPIHVAEVSWRGRSQRVCIPLP